MTWTFGWGLGVVEGVLKLYWLLFNTPCKCNMVLFFYWSPPKFFMYKISLYPLSFREMSEQLNGIL